MRVGVTPKILGSDRSRRYWDYFRMGGMIEVLGLNLLGWQKLCCLHPDALKRLEECAFMVGHEASYRYVRSCPGCVLLAKRIRIFF